MAKTLLVLMLALTFSGCEHKRGAGAYGSCWQRRELDTCTENGRDYIITGGGKIEILDPHGFIGKCKDGVEAKFDLENTQVTITGCGEPVTIHKRDGG